MAKKRKTKPLKKVGTPIKYRNALAKLASRRSGAGKHKDKRLKRKDRNSWRNLEENKP